MPCLFRQITFDLSCLFSGRLNNKNAAPHRRLGVRLLWLIKSEWGLVVLVATQSVGGFNVERVVSGGACGQPLDGYRGAIVGQECFNFTLLAIR